MTCGKNLKPEELGDLLDGSTLAVLATHMKDGQTLLSPVWQEFRDGGFTVAAFANDVKTRHLKRDPDVSRGPRKKNGALHSVIRVSYQAATSACSGTSLRRW